MVRAIGDKNTPILGLKSLIYYITGEWNCFLKFLKAALEAGLEKALGNAFVQYLHDGATLANHIKYQGVALQFVDPEWACNHVVAIGLKCAHHRRPHHHHPRLRTARPRLAYVQCVGSTHRGKLPCASGTYRQEADTHSTYVQYGGPGRACQL